MRLQFEYEKNKWESVVQASMPHVLAPEQYHPKTDYRQIPPVNNAPPFLMFPSKSNPGTDGFDYYSDAHDNVENKTPNKGTTVTGAWGYDIPPSIHSWDKMQSLEEYETEGFTSSKNSESDAIEVDLSKHEPVHLLPKKRKFSCPLKAVKIQYEDEEKHQP